MQIETGRLLAVLACAFLAGLPAPAVDAFGLAGRAERNRQRALDEKIKSNDAATDKAVAEALASGKALVIMPAIDVLKRPHVDALGSASAPMSTYDFSMTVRWVNAGDSNKILRAGLLDVSERAKHRGVKRGEGGETQFVPLLPAYEGTTQGRYQVYLIDPGTYRIEGVDALLRRTSLPADASAKGRARGAVGVLTMKERPHEELEKYQEWRGAQYGKDFVTETYCTAVRVVNNHCVATKQVSHPITVVTRQAGYEDLYRKFEAPALETRSILDRPFARFTVEPGSIVLVDGFFADYPNADLDISRCVAQPQKQMQCPITSYAMTRLPASLQKFSELLVTSEDWAKRYPKLLKALRGAKSVVPEIDAQDSIGPADQGVGYRQTRKAGGQEAR